MKDRFSEHAGQYAAFRPHYPQEFFNFIFSQITHFDLAWDAGTGNGQAAVALASRFRKVVATDISAKQLENASKAENISYKVSGEATTLPDHTVDLITVAQAIHWFDRDKFYGECRRVGKSGAIVAVWGYGLLRNNDVIDPIVDNFYRNVVGPYWDPERKLIDQELKTIAFPFEEIASPPFVMSYAWTLDEFRGYVGTWSAVHNHIKENGSDPVPELIAELEPSWGRGQRTVAFPLFLRLGKVK